MVNRKANIDLLFRNGLRDFEVLPPHDAWNTIKPVIRRKQRPYIFLRTAAAITVLLSISFLTYRLGRENQSVLMNPVTAGIDQAGVVQTDGLLLTGEADPGGNMPRPAINGNMITAVQTPDTLENADAVISRQNSGLISRLAAFLPGNRSEAHGRNLIARNESGKTDFVPVYNTPAVEDYMTVAPQYRADRWSISAMASPTYYPRPQMNSDDISKQISLSEQAQVSYSGGIAFAYRISKKLSIQSGVYYSSMGQEVGEIYSFGGFNQYIYTKSNRNFEVLTSAGRIYTENTDIFLRDGIGDRVLTRYTNDVFDPAKASLQYMNSSLYQSFSYVEMPVILRYKLLDRNIDINLIGGLSYNLLVNNSVYTRFDGDKLNIGKTDGLNSFMLSSSLGMGMEYSLSKKFSLNLEPTFRYYMNPFSDGAGIISHPYSFGIFSGLSYKF